MHINRPTHEKEKKPFNSYQLYYTMLYYGTIHTAILLYSTVSN